MNTKKAIWVKKPGNRIMINLHSYSYENKEESSVYFTLGEEGSVKLKAEAKGEARVEYVLLHTPSDTVVFNGEEIAVNFFGLESHIMLKAFGELEMSKSGDSLRFLMDGKEVYTMKNPAFAGSASLGVRAIGQGHIDITVF